MKHIQQLVTKKMSPFLGGMSGLGICGVLVSVSVQFSPFFVSRLYLVSFM